MFVVYKIIIIKFTYFYFFTLRCDKKVRT